MRISALLFSLLVSSHIHAAIYSMSLPLQWQERKIGEASFVLENFSLHSIEGDALALPISHLISKDLKQFLENSEGEISMATLQERGVSLTLNTKDLIVTLELQQQAMAVDQLTYGNRNYLATPSPSTKYSILNDINLRIDESNQEQDSISLDWFAESNFGGHDGYNLNWSAFYDKDENSEEFFRGDITLFHDNFSQPRRLEIGDISGFNRGHLPSVNAGGVGLSTPYQQLQPLKRISPTNSQEFYMRQSGEVQVVVNSNIVAKVRLNPGRYDLNDLPLSTGQNDVQIVAIYANGERETFTFNTFYNSQLLEKGLSIWAFNVGYPSEFRDFRYDYLDPIVMTGFYEKGITETITAGINGLFAQGDYIIGSHATAGTSWGNFTLRMTASEYQDEAGSIISLDTEHTIFGSSEFGVPNLRLSYQERENFVQSPWQDNPSSNTDESWSINYSWYITDRIDFNVNARQSKDSSNIATKNISAQLNWRYKDIRVSAQYQKQENDGLINRDNETLFINMNWSAFSTKSRSRTRFDYRSQNNDYRASYAKINRNYQNDFGYNVEANSNDDSDNLSLSGSYTHNRFRVDVSSRVQQRPEFARTVDHRINLSTSVGIADGKIGIGSNVQVPFAIIEAHPTLAESEIQVNPSPTGESLGSADVNVGGLVSLGSAFTENVVTVNALDVPLGYDWGPGTYSVVGGTNTGHLITIGSDLSYTVIGYVKDSNNEPITLQRGKIESLSNAAGKDFSAALFSNRRGRFVIEGIGTGEYIVRFGNQSAVFTIEPADISLVRLGTITLSQNNSFSEDKSSLKENKSSEESSSSKEGSKSENNTPTGEP